jgi:ParB-like chromosome segregation protein Spo0J
MAKSKLKTAATPASPLAMSGLPQTRKLAEIKPYPMNARTHPPDQISLLAGMLKRWGPDQPIVVDETGMILKGHGRLLAAAEAGMTEFPVVVRSGLSETEKNALRLSDNKVALLSGWDLEKLRLGMNDLKLANFEMPMIGFSLDEMQQLNIGVLTLDQLPALPDGEKSPFQQMTFVLHDTQVPMVMNAIEKAKANAPDGDNVNANKNGAALALICEAFIDAA